MARMQPGAGAGCVTSSSDTQNGSLPCARLIPPGRTHLFKPELKLTTCRGSPSPPCLKTALSPSPLPFFLFSISSSSLYTTFDCPLSSRPRRKWALLRSAAIDHPGIGARSQLASRPAHLFFATIVPRSARRRNRRLRPSAPCCCYYCRLSLGRATLLSAGARPPSLCPKPLNLGTELLYHETCAARLLCVTARFDAICAFHLAPCNPSLVAVPHPSRRPSCVPQPQQRLFVARHLPLLALASGPLRSHKQLPRSESQA